MSSAEAPTVLTEIDRDLVDLQKPGSAVMRDFSWIYDALHEILAVHLHQVRGPLTAISGWAQVLEQAGSNADLVAEAAETIKTAVAEQSAHLRVLDDMLAIARGEVVEREYLPLSTLVTEACESCLCEAQERNVTLVW